MTKVSKEFIVGKNNIAYVWSDFADHFNHMEFEKTETKLVSKVLKKSMTDKAILSELNPAECTLGDLLYALNNEVGMLKNGYANIFYIRDADNTLWAVFVVWDGDGWHVNADSVGSPYEWDADYRVFGRGFSDSMSFETLRPLRPLVLGHLAAIEKLIGEIRKELD